MELGGALVLSFREGRALYQRPLTLIVLYNLVVKFRRTRQCCCSDNFAEVLLGCFSMSVIKQASFNRPQENIHLEEWYWSHFVTMLKNHDIVFTSFKL